MRPPRQTDTPPRPVSANDRDSAPLQKDAEALAALAAGFDIFKPQAWQAGVVFASPHSGRHYPQAFQDQSPLSLAQLRRNEDFFVDQLIAGCVPSGAPLLSARFPRCYVDVNRAPTELPQDWAISPAKETPRAAAGLGVVPTHINERTPIYRTAPTRDQAHARLRTLYDPYHAALAGLIRDAQARFGQCLLVDCHSMPGFAPMGSRRPDIILGDRFGRSCIGETLAMVRTLFQQEGYSVAVNYPYAGGFITKHYGQPSLGVEVVQIEINRDLYLNPVTLSPKRGYDRLAAALDRIMGKIISARQLTDLAAQ
jgi:N-formylglutamate amidohydrolase